MEATARLRTRLALRGRPGASPRSRAPSHGPWSAGVGVMRVRVGLCNSGSIAVGPHRSVRPARDRLEPSAASTWAGAEALRPSALRAPVRRLTDCGDAQPPAFSTGPGYGPRWADSRPSVFAGARPAQRAVAAFLRQGVPPAVVCGGAGSSSGGTCRPGAVTADRSYVEDSIDHVPADRRQAASGRTRQGRRASFRVTYTISPSQMPAASGRIRREAVRSAKSEPDPVLATQCHREPRRVGGAGRSRATTFRPRTAVIDGPRGSQTITGRSWPRAARWSGFFDEHTALPGRRRRRRRPDRGLARSSACATRSPPSSPCRPCHRRPTRPGGVSGTSTSLVGP